MAGSPDWQDSDEQSLNEGRVPVSKVIGRCAAGWLVGCLIPLISTLLFFQLVHSGPGQPASTGVIWGMAVSGVFFAAVGSIVGASFYRPQALGIGAAIAATIAAVSMWIWYTTPNAAHWLQAVSILLMAPAAQFAALARRAD